MSVVRPRNGKYTQAAQARKMIEAGHGLSDAEIERFYAATNRIRQRRIEPKRATNELRGLLESRYGPR